jgi:hypothetical protein
MPDIILSDGHEAFAPGTTGLAVRTPEVAMAYDEELAMRKRAIALRQNALATIQFTILDANGNPVDVSDYDIEVRFREASLVDRTIYTATGTLVPPDMGLIEVTVPETVRETAGIFFAEAGVINGDGDLLMSNELYLYNEHSAWGDVSRKGPPQISDFRLSLRDSDPYENELIEHFDYGLVEICMAAVRAVVCWNEQPPAIGGLTFSTITMPYRDIWLTGGHLFLFEMAEEHYRRNFLAYNAGGMTTDDKNRHRDYAAAWQNRYQRYRELIMHKKAQANYARCYGGLGS